VLKYSTIFVLIFFSCFKSVSQQVLKSSEYDSIIKYRYISDDKAESLDRRLKYAKKAVELSNKLKVDSIILKSNRTLSFAYLINGEYEKFKNINFKNLSLAKKLNDSLATGVANQNLGWYYYINRVQNDSAYYYLSTAVKIYEDLKEDSRQISVLSNLSDIQEVEKDYFGSEEAAIKALLLLEGQPKSQENLATAWTLNNLLGIISLKLKNYDKSIEYHKKASEFANKINNGLMRDLASRNNVAFVYKEKGDIKTALKLYEEVLSNKQLFEIDPSFFALVLDNVAFTRFLNEDKNFTELEKMFKRAYKICDSLDDPITKMATTIDMAKFYKGIGVKDSSLHYANETYQLAKQTNENDMLLESLMILAELNEGEEGKKYFEEHIKLSDSLLNHERGIRNKFARVQFETDQIEQENERIARERFWLLMVSIVLVIAIFFLYVIVTQRAKNKELRFEQDQQKANEEIYNLMLSQQDKVDEARAQEKKRISEELHDGILGRLFGTRLSLDSFNFKEGPEGIKSRSQYINDLKNIEQDIRKISHDLNTDFVSGSGFVDIIDTLISTQTQAYQLKYDFYHSDDINWENVSNKTKIHIYRILQETMQNIYKHAEASLIKISFQLKNDVICLSISDDGKGFVINKSKKGIGLKNIHSRVDEVGGIVSYDSVIDKGTTITIDIPYTIK